MFEVKEVKEPLDLDFPPSVGAGVLPSASGPSAQVRRSSSKDGGVSSGGRLDEGGAGLRCGSGSRR